MHALFAMPLSLMASSSSAADIMQSFVTPVIRGLCWLAGPVCIFFIASGGIAYMTSTGRPEKLDHAKQILKNAAIGLSIVFAAAALTAILSHAYAGSSAAANAKLPDMSAIPLTPQSNGVIGFIIKTITGVLGDIVNFLAWPFIHSLEYFTKSTPLMADNPTVFHMWLAMTGIVDALFVLVVALLGFHVMSFSMLGLDELDLRHLLPRLCFIFLVVNTSIFAIDGIIELSNAMIHAITAANGATSLWSTLEDVTKQSAKMGFPALLIMIVFVVFSIILVVYYIGRLITLYMGAILSPLVLLLWVVPGFRDFAETAAKVYLMAVFVLFVHVIILQLAASLVGGVVVGSPTHVDGSLMPMVTGLAAIIALLKTQGVMTQFAYASVGPRGMRKLGALFVTSASATVKGGKAVYTTVSKSRSESSNSSGDTKGGGGSSSSGAAKGTTNSVSFKQPTAASSSSTTTSRRKTGETTPAPEPTKPKVMEKP